MTSENATNMRFLILTAPKYRDTFRNLCNDVHRTDRDKKKIVIHHYKKKNRDVVQHHQQRTQVDY